MKKDFKAEAERLVSKPTTQHTQDTRDTQAIKPTFYRLNLKLDGDLKEFLSDEAWRQRTSITALVNEVLKEYRVKKESEKNA